MTFTIEGSTVHATGQIERGDAAKFALLPKFGILDLNSPGGYVGEALAIAANMDKRGNIHTLVRTGSVCASACAMAIFVSGQIRVVQVGGKIGIHSCANADGTQSEECNKEMAANATAHGVPWGVIEAFGNGTKPENMLWLSAEDAECWGMLKWSPDDTSNNGLACFLKNVSSMQHKKPADVSAQNVSDILCRMNMPTSRIFLPNGDKEQGFGNSLRTNCERIALDPKTPRYAAIDIVLWLTLSDPGVRAIKPGTLVQSLVRNDPKQIENCWKCLTVMGMVLADAQQLKMSLSLLRQATRVVEAEEGSVPPWLTSRLDMIAKDEANGSAH